MKHILTTQAMPGERPVTRAAITRPTPISPQTNSMATQQLPQSSLYAFDQDPDVPAGDHEFVKTIIAKSKGGLDKPIHKQYNSFKDFYLDKPFLQVNAAKNQAHITSGYDYHMKSMMRFWGTTYPTGYPTESSTSENSIDIDELHTHSKTPVLYRSTRSNGQPILKSTSRSLSKASFHDEYKDTPGSGVQVFGRTRVMRPFSRTTSLHLDAKRATFVREEEILPNPTTYRPYPDSWVQPLAPCAPMNELSSFRSRSPQRAMMHSFYKHDAEEVRSRFYREAYGYSKDASHSPMRTAASSIGQRVASPPTSRIAFSLVSPPVGNAPSSSQSRLHPPSMAENQLPESAFGPFSQDWYGYGSYMSQGGVMGPRAATSPGRMTNRGDNNRLSPSSPPSPLGFDEYNHSRPLSHISAIYGSPSRADSPTLLNLPSGAGTEKTASLQQHHHQNPILSATSINRNSFRSLNDSDNDNDSVKSSLSMKKFRRGKSAPGLITQPVNSPPKIRSRSQSPLVNETNATGLAPLLVFDKESLVDVGGSPSALIPISSSSSSNVELLSPMQQSPAPFSPSEKSTRSPSSRLPSPSHPLRNSSRNTSAQNISQRESRDNLLGHGSPPSSPGSPGGSFARGPKGATLSTKEVNSGVGVNDTHAPHVRVRLPDGTPVIFTGSPEPFDLRHGVVPEHNWNATTTARDLSHHHFPLLDELVVAPFRVSPISPIAPYSPTRKYPVNTTGGTTTIAAGANTTMIPNSSSYGKTNNVSSSNNSLSHNIYRNPLQSPTTSMKLQTIMGKGVLDTVVNVAATGATVYIRTSKTGKNGKGTIETNKIKPVHHQIPTSPVVFRPLTVSPIHSPKGNSLGLSTGVRGLTGVITQPLRTPTVCEYKSPVFQSKSILERKFEARQAEQREKQAHSNFAAGGRSHTSGLIYGAVADLVPIAVPHPRWPGDGGNDEVNHGSFTSIIHKPLFPLLTPEKRKTTGNPTPTESHPSPLSADGSVTVPTS